MDSLNQIAQDLLSIVRERRVDDYNVTSAQVKRWIEDKRAEFVSNELNKKRAIDEDLVQDLGCVAIEKVPNAPCGPGCMVLRTCKPVPTVLKTNDQLAFTRIGPVKITSRPFAFVDYSRITWSGNGRFAGNIVFAYYLNGYIYLELKAASPLARGMKYVNIRGVFETPSEVANFTTCAGDTCFDLDKEYPLKKKMKNSIMNAILQERFGIVEQGIIDKRNDEAGPEEI